MYTCHVCHQSFPYLILEYDATVCENCSIKKNISNSGEFDALSESFSDAESEVEVHYVFQDVDAQQLFDAIEKIENPQIREDFLDFAEQYLDEM